MSDQLDLAELRRLSAAVRPDWLLDATRPLSHFVGLLTCDGRYDDTPDLIAEAEYLRALLIAAPALLDRIESNERAIALGDARVRELEAQAATSGDTLTKRQAAIIGAFTGVTCGPFSDIHEYVDSLPGFEGIYTHNFGDREIMERVREAAKPDFLALCHRGDGDEAATVAHRAQGGGA